jgi:uncharacterized damage-inducible protein DinB
MNEVQDFIRQLQEGIQETMAKIDQIPEEYLDEACRHICARGGEVWHLLTHNIEHEKMHTGNITGIRDSLRRLQQDRKSRLMAEYYMARAALIASLFGLEDSDLDADAMATGRWTEGRWTIRQELEHMLKNDRGSIDDMLAEYQERQGVPAR